MLHSPHLGLMRSPLLALVANLPHVLVLALKFSTSVTCVKVTVHNVKGIAILNTGSMVNGFLSQLAQNIKMAPNLNHSVVYCTAGMPSTKLIGAYLALLLSSEKLLLTFTTVLL